MAPRASVNIGDKYGRLTVVKELKPVGYTRYVKCSCTCGELKNVKLSHLRSGAISSCGCYRSEVTSTRHTSHGLAKIGPDGRRLIVEYDVYKNMLHRCYNKNNTHFDRYGGRGIKVCKRWRNGEKGKTGVECFITDMGKRPASNYELDRTDNNKGYSPRNCKWVTKIKNSSNTRQNVKITINNKTKTVTQWAFINGINASTAYNRIRRGWEPLRAVTEPVIVSGKRKIT